VKLVADTTGPMFTRRDLFAAVAGGFATPVLGETSNFAPSPPPPPPSLREAAARSGRFFGAAARLGQIRAEPDFAAVMLAECSAMTPELALKWAAIEPERGRMTFDLMDEFADYAKLHSLSVHGHTLLWHRSVPNWVEEYLEANADWSLVRRHFASVMPRYGDVITRWDVVNEPIETGYREDGLRQNLFFRSFGASYVERALVDARMFAPQGRLYLNDYGLDLAVAEDNDRRYLLLKLVERLKSSGIPLDGIGVQAHLDLRKGPFDETIFSHFLEDISGFGLEILVTELDVVESDYRASPDERDRHVAEIVKRYLDVALSHTTLAGVSTWGLSDRHSWLTVPPEALPVDGTRGPGLNRGLPYAADMRPKPMRQAILDAFLNAVPFNQQEG